MAFIYRFIANTGISILNAVGLYTTNQMQDSANKFLQRVDPLVANAPPVRARGKRIRPKKSGKKRMKAMGTNAPGKNQNIPSHWKTGAKRKRSDQSLGLEKEQSRKKRQSVQQPAMGQTETRDDSNSPEKNQDTPSYSKTGAKRERSGQSLGLGKEQSRKKRQSVQQPAMGQTETRDDSNSPAELTAENPNNRRLRHGSIDTAFDSGKGSPISVADNEESPSRYLADSDGELPVTSIGKTCEDNDHDFNDEDADYVDQDPEDSDHAESHRRARKGKSRLATCALQLPPPSKPHPMYDPICGKWHGSAEAVKNHVTSYHIGPFAAG